jgi:hypothetical protein
MAEEGSAQIKFQKGLLNAGGDTFSTKKVNDIPASSNCSKHGGRYP